jgi:hypothetical protein
LLRQARDGDVVTEGGRESRSASARAAVQPELDNLGDMPVTRGHGRPYVVAHVAVSLDGATTGFQPDVARFYRLARIWDEDATLAGADTILAQEAALVDAPRPGPAEDGPLLAVVDG